MGQIYHAELTQPPLLHHLLAPLPLSVNVIYGWLPQGGWRLEDLPLHPLHPVRGHSRGALVSGMISLDP